MDVVVDTFEEDKVVDAVEGSVVDALQIPPPSDGGFCPFLDFDLFLLELCV